MAIPDYQTLMLPLLKFTSDKKEHSSVKQLKGSHQNFLSQTKSVQHFY